MTRAIAILGVVLCVSLLEGLWAWLLVAAISEVAGQVHPLFVFVGLVLFAAWLTARIMILNDVSVDRQRLVLIAVGLGLALVAGTVHAGLLVPFQLVFGAYTPDLRGAGVAMVVLVAYLWGRGLAMATEVTRDRVINHIAISSAALIAVLVFLPLTQAVQSLGLGMVVASFAIAIAALLLVQAIGVEAHELTPTRWGLIASGFVIILLLVGAVLTGALSSSLLISIAGGFRALGQLMTPVTNAILLALGHLTGWIVDRLVWLGEFFGNDAAEVMRNMWAAEQAREQARTQYEQEAQESAPALLSGLVAVFCTLFFGTIAVMIFNRLIGMYGQGDDFDVQESRSRVRRPKGNGLRDLFGRLRHRGNEDSDLDVRNAKQAIRLHYRRFQVLMARAGLPRTAHDTPLEYGEQLAGVLPTARNDLLEIATAYDQARYSEPESTVPPPGEIEQAVHRVRGALLSLPERPKSEA
jgi:hypothetical protein